MKRYEVVVQRIREERIVLDAESREHAMERALELAEDEPSWFSLNDEEIKVLDGEEVLLEDDDN